jgi:hypothetical protein
VKLRVLALFLILGHLVALCANWQTLYKIIKLLVRPARFTPERTGYPTNQISWQLLSLLLLPPTLSGIRVSFSLSLLSARPLLKWKRHFNSGPKQLLSGISVGRAGDLSEVLSRTQNRIIIVRSGTCYFVGFVASRPQPRLNSYHASMPHEER